MRIVIPVALRGRKDGAELEHGEAGDPSYSLRTGSGGSSKPMVAVCTTGNVTHTLTAEGADASEDGTGRETPTVAIEDIGVRRLTPLECERLQGYPNNYTNGQSDAQRYRQMGNTVAIPVVKGVAGRLVYVDHCLREASAED